MPSSPWACQGWCSMLMSGLWSRMKSWPSGSRSSANRLDLWSSLCPRAFHLFRWTPWICLLPLRIFCPLLTSFTLLDRGIISNVCWRFVLKVIGTCFGTLEIWTMDGCNLAQLPLRGFCRSISCSIRFLVLLLMPPISLHGFTHCLGWVVSKKQPKAVCASAKPLRSRRFG